MLATGIIGGSYLLVVSVSSILLGAVLDRLRKITVVRISSVLTLVFFTAAGLQYRSVLQEMITDL